LEFLRKEVKFMRKIFLFFIVFLNFSLILEGQEINFSIGINYLSSYYKFTSYYDDIYLDPDYGYSESYAFPIGPTFSLNLETKKGIGLDINFGPISYTLFRVSDYYGEETENINLYDIPISIDVKYIILPKNQRSLYLFIGKIKHFARSSGGKFIDKDGILSGLGLRFLKNKIKSTAVEISYDTSQIYIGEKGFISPYGFILSIIFTF